MNRLRAADGNRVFGVFRAFCKAIDSVPGQDPRHAGTLEPLWNTFDLTPEGRPADWQEQIDYSR